VEDRQTISACVAVYNGADHIERALRSILEQTEPPDEILVVDDGSTDCSLDIASSFEGVRVIHQANGGIGAARKRLAEGAKGDWIAFCDHDDWWEPSRLQVGRAFIEDPQVVLVYSGVWHEDALGNQNSPPLHARADAPSIEHVVPNPEDIWTSSTLLRRRAVLDAGNFNPRFRTGEDMLMWFQLGGLGKIVQIPERLVHMLRRADSTSSGNKKQFEHGVALYEEEVLPNLDMWYSHVPKERRDACKALLRAKLGYALAILATYEDLDGDHQSALSMYRRAAKLSPKSKGVWYRYIRGLMRIPVRPPS